MRETREWSRPLAALGVLLCAFVACHAQEATTSAGGGEQPMPTIPVPTNKPTCDELDDCANCVDPDPWCIRCNRREVISIDRTKCLDCEANCMHCYHQDDSVHPAEDEVTVCMRCDEGYLLDNSTDPVTCLPCGSRCHRCEINGEGKCDEGHCYAGYRYNADEQICEQCGLNCNNCDTAGPSKCDSGECYDKYYYSSLTETCQACGQYCSKCDSNGAGKCDSGSCDAETVYVEATQTCERCDPNCNACADNGPGKCDSGQCKDPWALSVSNNCAPCDSHCHSCQSAGQNLCDPGQCHARYYLNPTTNVCQACADHCLQCSVGGGLCDAGMCMEGYGYKANSQLCEPCPSNCKTCDISNEGVKTCSECVETFKLTGADNSVCDFCPDNCHTCVAAGLTRQCVNSGCDARYAINTNGGTCHACPANCLTCTYSSSGTKCTRGGCDPGFADRASDGKCYACPTSCSRCTDDGLGTRCDYDYCTGRTAYSPVDATCPECPSNCDSCYFHTDGAMKCARCETGFTLTENDVGCAECPSNCNRCYFDGTLLKCYDQGCEIGYVLNNAHECSSCPSRCDDCLYDTVTDRVGLCKIDKCEPGYIQATTSSRTCLACSNCDVCSLNTAGNRAECTGNCNNGYVKRDSDKTCIPCPAGCNQCTLSGSTTTTCITNQCDAPSFVQVTEPSCVACPIGCLECSYDTGDAEYRCTRCDTNNGFLLRDSKCYPCPPNCNRCTFNVDEARTICSTSQCKAGYTTQDGLCVACAPNCLNCNSAGPGGCNSCEGGYTEAAGNTGCESCASNCDDCNTAGQCSTCSHGYIPSGTECVACADFCDDCTLAGAGQCDTCMRGYAKSPTDNMCYPCPDNCQYCELGADETTPTCMWGGCKPGFIMKDRERMCEACSEGCAQCRLEENNDGSAGDEYCLNDACKLGYVYNPTSRRCDACPSKCIKCIDANTCEINGCVEGYTSDAPDDNGQCLACSRSIVSVINCYKCDTAGEGKCDAGQCHPGYALNSDLVCRACALNCESCTTPDDCTVSTCANGYVYYEAGTSINKCLPWSSTSPRACDENCAVAVCDTMGTCRDDCAPGYTKAADNTCAPCAANCLTCDDTGAGQCDPTGCDIANNWSYDTTPENGIYCLEDACVDRCSSCVTAGTCSPDSCTGDNKFDPTNQDCDGCANGCTSGQCDTQDTCWRFHCQDGEGLVTITDESGTCDDCSDNCGFCNIAGAAKCDVDKCTDVPGPPQVNYERHPSLGTCHEVACVSGCEVCVEMAVSQNAANGGLKCDAAAYCESGYAYNGDDECDSCDVSGCTVCESDVTTCDICASETFQLTCGACEQANCLVCDTDRLLCDICDDGYRLTTAGACEVCGEVPCALCDSDNAANSCDECPTGTVWNADACTACTDTNCAYCDPETPATCLVCNDGFSIRQGSTTCTACDVSSAANCLQCELGDGLQSDTCDVCLPGFVMWTKTNTNPLEVMCKECSEHCASCTAPGTCTTCSEGFRLLGSICVPCPRYCESCNAATGSCEDCQDGFYATGSNPTICSPCPQNCKSCNSNGCTTCEIGFKHVENFCSHACDDENCAVCSPSATCTACKPGYTLNGGTTCVGCTIIGCLDCESAIAGCDTCPDGQVLNAAPNACIDCPIANCVTCTAHNVCDECETDYFPATGGGATCTLCNDADNGGIAGCKECSATATCDVCEKGSTVTAGPPVTCDGTCGVANCAVCLTASTCTQCDDDYYLASSSECRSCDNADCIECADTENICTKCTGDDKGPAAGASTACAQCTPASNCKQCVDDVDECSECNAGAYLNPTSKVCVDCTVNGCSDCPTGEGICSACTDPGQEPNLAGSACVACLNNRPNCIRCETVDSCGRCDDGYYLDTSVADNYDCEECHPSCETCDGPLQTDCLTNSCSEGYYWDESDEACFKAFPGCTNPGSAGCEDATCDQYYEPHSDSYCLPCIRFCKTCSAVGDCEVCDDGYYLMEATRTPLAPERCVSCGAYCTNCAADDSCDECAEGFTLENGVCKACAKYCMNCDDANGETYGPGKCQPTQCMEGHLYDPDEEDCFGLQAPPGCISSTSSKCLDGCVAGYVYDSTDKWCYEYQDENGDGCAANCNHCTTPGTCTSQSNCINALFNPSGPRCDGACHVNCMPYADGGCSVNGQCLAGKCAYNYGFNEDDGSCVQCTANCMICDENGAGNCDEDMCDFGFAYDASDMSCKRIFCESSGYLRVTDNTCDGLACPDGCKACDYLTRDGTPTGTLYCLEDACEHGWTWSDTNGGTCVECTVANCEVCETTNICLASGCMYGYARTAGGTCSACPTGCNKCEEVGGAIVCMDEECFGDYVQIASLKCIDCPPSCQQCTYNTQLNTITCSPTMCEPGFVTLTNGICYPCPPNCLLCTYSEALSKSTCNAVENACEEGYALDANTVCQECPNHCDECTWNAAANQMKCDINKCRDGYAQNPTTRECKACPAGCDVCIYDSSVASETKCVEGGCELGYYQNEDRSCAECPGSRCERCAPSIVGSTILWCLDDQCEDGYGIRDTDRQCYSCGNGCKECAVNDADPNTVVCEECYAKYILHEGVCHACPDNCNTCTYDAVQQFSICDISACEARYAQNAADPRRACMPCPDKCLTCTYNTDASRAECADNACEALYDVDANFQCAKCADNCAVCTTIGPGKCDTCNTGYTVQDEVCAQCDPNCNQCNSKGATKCDGQTHCHARFYYNSENEICEACDPNCQQCTSNGGTFCDNNQCNARFVLKPDNQCESCPDHCQSCTYNAEQSRAECEENRCDARYGLKTSDFTCSACPLNCLECEWRNEKMVCTTCVPDYIINEEQCGACPQYCTKCSPQDGYLQCDECRDGYVLMDDRSCEICPPNCISCEQSGGVKTCTMCLTDRFSYNTDTHCIDCSTLAFSNCIMCTDQDRNGLSTCLECAAGYALLADRSECVPCSAHTTDCGVCEDHAAQCAACDTGFAEGPDGLFCGLECNLCMGPHCDSTTNDEKIVCPDEFSCWMYRIERDGDILHYRGCANITDECTSEYSTQFCQNRGEGSDAFKECKQCCTEPNCNTVILNGDTSGTTHIVYSAVTMVTCVVLAVVGGVLDNPLRFI